MHKNIFVLDVDGSVSLDDFYRRLADIVGAPRWHGLNINAFIDSIVFGDLNVLAPPYQIDVVNLSKVSPELSSEILDELKFLNEAISDEGLSEKIIIRAL